VGQVVSIQIASEAGGNMIHRDEINAIAGKGLEGDRYFKETGKFSDRPGPARQVSLIEYESVEAMNQEQQLELNLADTRRNIITQGVPLNHLINKQFAVGEVLLKGVKLCEPCTYLESLTRRGVKNGLIHRGGLRAEILKGGIIRVGDRIRPVG
jgi:MOSC domain-containing protein YiiM